MELTSATTWQLSQSNRHTVTETRLDQQWRARTYALVSQEISYKRASKKLHQCTRNNQETLLQNEDMSSNTIENRFTRLTARYGGDADQGPSWHYMLSVDLEAQFCTTESSCTSKAARKRPTVTNIMGDYSPPDWIPRYRLLYCSVRQSSGLHQNNTSRQPRVQQLLP